MDTASITLRHAQKGDLDALDRMMMVSFPRLLKADYPPSVQVTAIPLIARANPALVESGRYFVAEDIDGTVVGAGGWSRRSGRVGEVRHLVTHADHLRRGIAWRIMARVFHSAAMVGITRLDCLATRTAVPFYAALGFKAGDEITVALRPGIGLPVVPMCRALPQD